MSEDADRARRDVETELKDKAERIVVLRDLVEAWKAQAETLKEQCDNKLKRQEREVAAAQATATTLREELQKKAAMGKDRASEGQERKYARLKEDAKRLAASEKALKQEVCFTFLLLRRSYFDLRTLTPPTSSHSLSSK